jgi:hypothetical protein
MGSTPVVTTALPFGPGAFDEMQANRLRDISLQHRLNLAQGVVVLRGGVRDDAVGGREKLKLALSRFSHGCFS